MPKLVPITHRELARKLRGNPHQPSSRLLLGGQRPHHPHSKPSWRRAQGNFAQHHPRNANQRRIIQCAVKVRGHRTKRQNFYRRKRSKQRLGIFSSFPSPARVSSTEFPSVQLRPLTARSTARARRRAVKQEMTSKRAKTTQFLSRNDAYRPDHPRLIVVRPRAPRAPSDMRNPHVRSR